MWDVRKSRKIGKYTFQYQVPSDICEDPTDYTIHVSDTYIYKFESIYLCVVEQSVWKLIMQGRNKLEVIYSATVGP